MARRTRTSSFIIISRRLTYLTRTDNKRSVDYWFARSQKCPFTVPILYSSRLVNPLLTRIDDKPIPDRLPVRWLRLLIVSSKEDWARSRTGSLPLRLADRHRPGPPYRNLIQSKKQITFYQFSNSFQLSSLLNIFNADSSTQRKKTHTVQSNWFSLTVL